MDEKAIKGSKVKVVIPPRPKPIEPTVYPCNICGTPILDKSPCGVMEIDGEMKVVCLECKKKSTV